VTLFVTFVFFLIIARSNPKYRTAIATLEAKNYCDLETVTSEVKRFPNLWLDYQTLKKWQENKIHTTRSQIQKSSKLNIKQLSNG